MLHKDRASMAHARPHPQARSNDRPLTWHVHFAGVRVGVIVERSGVANCEYLPKCSEADFAERRDQEAWTAEKYRRFDRHERMPPDRRARG